ncbi:MAG: hypothetical protein QM765_30235 [Myxococcales bacterium]
MRAVTPSALLVALNLFLLAGCDEPITSPDTGKSTRRDAGPRADAQTPKPDGAVLDPADAGSSDAETSLDAAPSGPDAAPAGPDAAMLPDDGGSLYDPAKLDGCLEATGGGTVATGAFADGTEQASVSITASGCRRTYSLQTNIAVRDNFPANPRSFSEPATWPTVRTKNDLFDALYAMALEEVGEDSVDKIVDTAFNGGNPLDCPAGGCFQTGRKWPYVWTRDTSFSVDLGLSPLDPTRARNSLEFKLSERRSGGDLQIVQDTGTGGSYPMSSDRVVWALGAAELLKYLDGTERTNFRDRAYEAIKNTVEHDRKVVFDESDGLYRGETSFLDWREQTYANWTAADTVHIGMSKALSTNVLHLEALRTAAALASEKSDGAAYNRYQGWASALQTAIHTKFWIGAEKLYGSYTGTFLDPATHQRYDLLGEALAVLAGVPDAAQASSILASYPHAGKGPPVIWPQQQDTAIYHNRSIWPFVTAYWLKAAKAVRNDQVADKAVWSLMRGAALNLSNMENFELVTGKNCLEENGKACEDWSPGVTSGPKVNSQRQLWSVAGYLSMVHDVVFGLEASRDGVRFQPYLTRNLRNTLFANADTLVLNQFPYKGKKITVVVVLPPKSAATTGAYSVARVLLNGKPVGEGFIGPSALAAANMVEVYLAENPEAASAMKTVDPSDYRRLYGPKTPELTGIAADAGLVKLTFNTGTESASDVSFDVFRDGVEVASNLPGSTTTWSDPASGSLGNRTYCYAVATRFTVSGNRSQHSAPQCYWGTNSVRVQTWDPSSASYVVVGGEKILNHGRWHYQNWGDAGHSLTIENVRPSISGRHLVQTTEGNGGRINTGITCAVKRVTVEESGGAVVARGYLTMPHLGDWESWKGSNFFPVTLDASKTYRIRIDNDDASVNMSFFSHFSTYNSTGGSSGTFNRTNLADVKLLAIGQ